MASYKHIHLHDGANGGFSPSVLLSGGITFPIVGYCTTALFPALGLLFWMFCRLLFLILLRWFIRFLWSGSLWTACHWFWLGGFRLGFCWPFLRNTSPRVVLGISKIPKSIDETLNVLGNWNNRTPSTIRCCEDCLRVRDDKWVCKSCVFVILTYVTCRLLVEIG